MAFSFSIKIPFFLLPVDESSIDWILHQLLGGVFACWWFDDNKTNSQLILNLFLTVVPIPTVQGGQMVGRTHSARPSRIPNEVSGDT